MEIDVDVSNDLLSQNLLKNKLKRDYGYPLQLKNDLENGEPVKVIDSGDELYKDSAQSKTNRRYFKSTFTTKLCVLATKITNDITENKTGFGLTLELGGSKVELNKDSAISEEANLFMLKQTDLQSKCNSPRRRRISRISFDLDSTMVDQKKSSFTGSESEDEGIYSMQESIDDSAYSTTVFTPLLSKRRGFTDSSIFSTNRTSTPKKNVEHEGLKNKTIAESDDEDDWPVIPLTKPVVIKYVYYLSKTRGKDGKCISWNQKISSAKITKPEKDIPEDVHQKENVSKIEGSGDSLTLQLEAESFENSGYFSDISSLEESKQLNLKDEKRKEVRKCNGTGHSVKETPGKFISNKKITLSMTTPENMELEKVLPMEKEQNNVSRKILKLRYDTKSSEFCEAEPTTKNKVTSGSDTTTNTKQALEATDEREDTSERIKDDLSSSNLESEETREEIEQSECEKDFFAHSFLFKNEEDSDIINRAGVTATDKSKTDNPERNSSFRGQKNVKETDGFQYKPMIIVLLSFILLLISWFVVSLFYDQQEENTSYEKMVSGLNYYTKIGLDVDISRMKQSVDLTIASEETDSCSNPVLMQTFTNKSTTC